MEISDQAELLRHVHFNQWLTGERRPASVNFRDRELSTNLSTIWGVEETKRDDSGAVISLEAGECRALNQEVKHTPIPEGDPNGPNPAHTDVKGEKTKLVMRKMAEMAKAVWVRS